ERAGRRPRQALGIQPQATGITIGNLKRHPVSLWDFSTLPNRAMKLAQPQAARKERSNAEAKTKQP
ncbi:MAG: hypothetical protein AAF583_11835, partial [Pseudomonadota bacterium]